ncbi:MAG: isoprenylcysteine carboxylmethyltransferase family protein [Candidatus Thorarchaeota archaeon]|nr:isoprenylcysteine carboxylmethyltransferase family protein [Candidatus Thorarchaeota archaeon]
MIEWLNAGMLILVTALMVYFYKLSVSPAQMEKQIGDSAWAKCARYRIAMGILESVTVINYIVYFFFPLDVGLPSILPWDYSISVLLAILITVPALYLMLAGMRDAGRETIAPQKETKLYGGIYEKMRHPQALGEGFMWFPFALILNSPFLVLYSFVFIPIMVAFCVFEEKDLLIRFGTEYEEYRKRVGLLPRLRKSS